MASKSHPIKALRNELSDIMQKVSEQGNEALNEASEIVTRNMINATPKDTGQTANSWVNITKYNMVKYIFNNNVSKAGIPVVNLLEFGSKGRPFAIRTFEQSFSDIESIIINKFNKID